jgi:toxin ParE1/3/4
MFSLVVHKTAATELVESKTFYNKRVLGLGIEFETEVLTTFDLILENPKAFPIIQSPIRKVVLKRFPFVILYSVENNVIIILHVFHTSRNPQY